MSTRKGSSGRHDRGSQGISSSVTPRWCTAAFSGGHPSATTSSRMCGPSQRTLSTI